MGGGRVFYRQPAKSQPLGMRFYVRGYCLDGHYGHHITSRIMTAVTALCLQCHWTMT